MNPLALSSLKYGPVFIQLYTVKPPDQTEVGRADETSSVVSNAQVGVGRSERQREYSAEAECMRTAEFWMTRDGSHRPHALQQVGSKPEMLKQLCTHTTSHSMTSAYAFLCNRTM